MSCGLPSTNAILRPAGRQKVGIYKQKNAPEPGVKWFRGILGYPCQHEQVSKVYFVMASLIELNSFPETPVSADDIAVRKWCTVCGEWKAAIVLRADTMDAELMESGREITYCPECGARLRPTQSSATC